MTEGHTPLFHERKSYRRRRLIDMIRMLPLIGAFLWAVPLLWPSGKDSATPTSLAIIYLFAVWLGMVLLGALLARLLKKAEDQDPDRGT
ncbi:hypothetical protein SAMN05444000_10378 [Shimia gijangensis]|uniref:Uncharacterized protein n=1 Tax=Shimia gijangensis TaxID=1470563 RepID=A0A1M6E1U5_9RHOB|nr:hypothetical protein [Shimia gijangensis]SHI79340.1 hypothetical protein SAMN05444000_10378 [Shimia gijangensis]